MHGTKPCLQGRLDRSRVWGGFCRHGFIRADGQKADTCTARGRAYKGGWIDRECEVGFVGTDSSVHRLVRHAISCRSRAEELA